MNEDSAKPESQSARRVDQMYQQHAQSLRLFLLGVLRDVAAVDDVLQQTFAKLQTHYETAQPAGENTKADDQEISAGWLFRVAHNEALQLIRQRKRAKKHHEGFAWFKQAMSDGQFDELIDTERAQRVQQALSALPDELEQIVRLRFFEEQKFSEIADTLKIPLGTALGRMTQAIKRLKAALADPE